MTLNLSVSNLTVTDATNGRRLLDNVSFALAASNSLLVLGASGSGKSLLCRGLLGFWPPTVQVSPDADVRVEGIRVTKPEDLLGRHAAWIPQEASAALNPLRRLSGHFGEVLAGSQATRRAGSLAILSALGLPAERAYRAYSHTLSAGMRQRAVIGLALASVPHLFIADEPTASLDGDTADLVCRALAAPLPDGRRRTLVVASHDVGRLERWCEHVMVLDHGRIVEQRTSKEYGCY